MPVPPTDTPLLTLTFPPSEPILDLSEWTPERKNAWPQASKNPRIIIPQLKGPHYDHRCLPLRRNTHANQHHMFLSVWSVCHNKSNEAPPISVCVTPEDIAFEREMTRMEATTKKILFLDFGTETYEFTASYRKLVE